MYIILIHWGGEVKSTPRWIHIFKILCHRMEANSAKCMYFKFHDHTFISEISTANVSFGYKGLLDLHDFSLSLGNLT